MDKKQMPISELPFNFDGLEPQYGQIKHAELICPGVYFIMTKFNTDRPRFAGEYLVVTEDSPAISPEARNFTTPLPTIPRMFLLWHLRPKSKIVNCQVKCNKEPKKISKGERQSRHLRGLKFMRKTKSSRKASEKAEKSEYLGNISRNRPLVFSLVPRCQGAWGSAK